MKIKRDRYLERLVALKHNGLVKVITGIRRCGKSYLLFNLFRGHLRKCGADSAHVIEIKLDDERQKALRNPIALGERIRARLPKDRKPRYVFIDEIQLCRKVRDPSVNLMENVIYNELLLRGCNVDVGVVPVTVRDGDKVEHRQYEIDFVVNFGVDKVYVQSAFSIPDEAKLKQETRSLRKSGDFFRKIVVRDGFMPPLADEDGIVHVGVVPFLLDESILLGGR